MIPYQSQSLLYYFLNGISLTALRGVLVVVNIKDLEIFLVLASTENMQKAAIICDKNPSALSKSLKRLENSLGISLFDRIGKNIRINASGLKLRNSAGKIVAQAKQTIEEFSVISSEQAYTIAAPSILLFRWASVLSKVLQQYSPQSTVSFNSVYEQQALEQLQQGIADIAIVTSNLVNHISNDMYCLPLGALTMQVAAAKNHPLVVEQSSQRVEVSTAELLDHTFVSPSVSPYCGQARGIGCDGWRNDIFPRKLNMVVNDYGVLGQIVRSGQALAYLPDYWLRDLDLVHVHISDCQYQCQEQLMLVSYQPALIELFQA